MALPILAAGAFWAAVAIAAPGSAASVMFGTITLLVLVIVIAYGLTFEIQLTGEALTLRRFATVKAMALSELATLASTAPTSGGWPVVTLTSRSGAVIKFAPKTLRQPGRRLVCRSLMEHVQAVGAHVEEGAAATLMSD